jgi:hypothetical protein
VNARLVLIALVVGVVAPVGCATHGLIPDTAPSAIAASDPTALIKVEGCGYQPLVTEGYAYCRVVEGPVGSMALTFIAPPQAKDCPDAPNPCVDFTIFFPDGSPAYQDSIPAGQTSKTVPWRTLVKKENFTVEDRGFWPFTYTIRWKDTQGNTFKTVSQGELRLRVIRSQVCPAGKPCSAYVPLRNAKDDPNFVWKWSQDGQLIQMTTGARTSVEYPAN